LTSNNVLSWFQLQYDSATTDDYWGGATLNVARCAVDTTGNFTRSITVGSARSALRFVGLAGGITTFEPIVSVSAVRVNGVSAAFTSYPVVGVCTLWHQHRTTNTGETVHIWRTRTQLSEGVRAYNWSATIYNGLSYTIAVSDDCVSWTNVGASWDGVNGNALGRYVRVTVANGAYLAATYTNAYSIMQTCPDAWRSPVGTANIPILKLDTAINAPVGTVIEFDCVVKGLKLDGTNSFSLDSIDFAFSTT
jgi:hypothetical protein